MLVRFLYETVQRVESLPPAYFMAVSTWAVRSMPRIRRVRPYDRVSDSQPYDERQSRFLVTEVDQYYLVFSD